MEVLATDDPVVVLERAGALLTREPILNNVLLTLLNARAAGSLAGRYWIVDTDDPAGVVFQSPTTFPALVSSMTPDRISAAVDAIAGAAVALPGVSGEAGTAARFAGAWTEATKSSGTPVQGQRIYEVREVVEPRGVSGRFRPATKDDEPVLVELTDAFMTAIGADGDASAIVAHRLPLGHFWLWDDDGAVSVAALSEPTGGVVRVQNVYTPPSLRGRGYASACVAFLSATALGGDRRCILYTDLANATSNSIYRSIGYRAVAEMLRYRFD
jgi:predicted GNAT family acetyltransferase